MQSGRVTTPFGRRPMTLALVKGQLEAGEAKPAAAIDKWKVFRDLSEAKAVFGLQDRALAVLHALLSFYPDTELSEERGLVVFPSNVQLSIRAHGITGTTLRKHLGILVEAGLILRRDSPNGKRYAHRSRGGEIEQAFGFDLAPLIARAGEIAQAAQAVAAETQRFKRIREALTICRRDVRKLITAAMEERAEGDWAGIETMYIALVARLPRAPNCQDVDCVLEDMLMLREEILNLLEIQLKTQKSDGNDDENRRHIQNSKPESIYELEPSSREEQGGKPSPDIKPVRVPQKAFPLSLVLRACPQIADYTTGGAITGWRDLMSAAVVVRSMLGVSPSAYQEACEVLGAENAAIAVACILERAEHINSAGGYLRDLTRKSARNEFGLGPMLMAALRANGEAEKRSA